MGRLYTYVCHLYIFRRILEKTKTLFDMLKIGSHIIQLRYLIFGYKIEDTNYYEINLILTIILYSIHKAYHISEQKTKNIDVFSIFKNEFLKIQNIYRLIFINSVIL